MAQDHGKVLTSNAEQVAVDINSAATLNALSYMVPLDVQVQYEWMKMMHSYRVRCDVPTSFGQMSKQYSFGRNAACVSITSKIIS